MTGLNVVKDPLADLDYTIDWSRWLGLDTIVASTWIVDPNSGMTQHDAAIDPTATKTTVWLRGGNISQMTFVVTNQITTNGSRTDERSFTVLLKSK